MRHSLKHRSTNRACTNTHSPAFLLVELLIASAFFSLASLSIVGLYSAARTQIARAQALLSASDQQKEHVQIFLVTAPTSLISLWRDLAQNVVLPTLPSLRITHHRVLKQHIVAYAIESE